MQQTNSGITLSLLLATSLLISGCSGIWSKPEKEIVVETKLIEKNIPIVPHPKQVKMHDVKIYVVSPSENFEEFKKEFEAKNGGDSYVAISIKEITFVVGFVDWCIIPLVEEDNIHPTRVLPVKSPKSIESPSDAIVIY